MPPPKTEQKPLQAVEQITPQQVEFKLKGILDEYLKDCCTVAKCDKDIHKYIPASTLSQLLSLGYDKIVEESTKARMRTATLLAEFIRMNMLPLESYCAGLEEVLEHVDDLTIENPKVWEYLAEMVALLIYENILPMEKLHASCKVLISQGNAGKFLGAILKLIVSRKSPNYLASLWHSSELIFEDFLPTNDVDKFIKDNQLEFLVDGVSTPASESTLTLEQIHEKLLEFFKNENSSDDMSDWITVNVADRVKDERFIRVLAAAVFENSVVGLNFNDEILRKHYNILSKYIDGNFEYEVQVLYALQAHINNLEDPQGLLLKVFMILYEDSMISPDSIAHWESNKDPAEEEDVDQCFPYNPPGKIVYDREFLLTLRNDPKSKKRPENLLDLVLREDPRQTENIVTGFSPSFSKSNHPSRLSLRDHMSHHGLLLPKQKPVEAVTQIAPERLENVLDEYLANSCTVVECSNYIRSYIPTSKLSKFVSEGYNKVLWRSKTARIRTATLFAQLIMIKTLPLERYCAGLEQILEQADDLTSDITNIWEYLSEIVAPLLYENTLPLKRLHASCNVLISLGHGAKLLGPVFKLVVSEKGPNYLTLLWNISELRFKDFMQAGDVDKFIKDNHLEFLVGGVNTSASQSADGFEQKTSKNEELKCFTM